MFPIIPNFFLGLFVPSQSITQSPPSYEEALKHKVILSNYNPGPPVVPPYTLQTSDVQRQYQTLQSNPSPSSSILLNTPNVQNSSVIIKTTTTTTSSGHHRSFPVGQTDGYRVLPISNDWPALQYNNGTHNDNDNDKTCNFTLF